MKLVLLSLPSFLLTLGFLRCGLFAGEPLMEKRTIFGPSSAQLWSAVESTLEFSTNRTKTQQPVLRWHILVDHFAGEAKYPIGWPRISVPLREATARNWSGWDYLQMWIYTDTSRPALPRDPVGMSLHTPDKEGAYHRSLAELKKGEWVQIRIPLSQLPRHDDVRLMQFHISESQYRHQDQLDFYFDEITLLRYAQPTLLEFASENAVVFADVKQAAVRFNLAGVKSSESVEVVCELRQTGKALAQTSARAGRGPQRFVLDLSRAQLTTGDYELVAHAVGGADTAATKVRLVESPWK